MPAERKSPRLLHLFSTFAVGGPQVRFITLANSLGDRYRHTVLALDGDVAAASRLAPGLDCRVEAVAAHKGSGLDLRSLAAIRERLDRLDPDILLTYNWGSIEWALVNRWPPQRPHVHFEDGFGPDEAHGRQIPRRVLMRRIALTGRRTRVVVPSRLLHRIATETWHLSPARVLYIPNGIDCGRFAAKGGAPAAPQGAPVIGTVGALRGEKNFGRLLRAVAALPGDLRPMVKIVGDGPERPGLESLAAELGLADRTVFAGHVGAPETVLPDFDVFALSSDTEQMPYSLIEAMAAGCAVVATDVGDVRAMLAEANRPFVVARDDEAAFSARLATLLRDSAMRDRLGAENRDRARREFDEKAMIARYDALLSDAVAAAGRPAGTRSP